MSEMEVVTTKELCQIYFHIVMNYVQNCVNFD